MMFGEWEAKIEERMGMMGYALWLRRRTPAGVELLTQNGKIKKVVSGKAYDSEDYFAYFDSHEALQAVADALSGFGMKTESTHKLEGVLDAQTKHLEDMRRLVFEQPETRIEMRHPDIHPINPEIAE